MESMTHTDPQSTDCPGCGAEAEGDWHFDGCPSRVVATPIFDEVQADLDRSAVALERRVRAQVELLSPDHTDREPVGWGDSWPLLMGALVAALLIVVIVAVWAPR